MGTLVFIHLSLNQLAWEHFHLRIRRCIWLQSTLPCYSIWETEINTYAIFITQEIVAFGQQVSCYFPINVNCWGKLSYNIFNRSMARVIEKFQYTSLHFLFGEGRGSWMSLQQFSFSNKTHWYVNLSFNRSFSGETHFNVLILFIYNYNFYVLRNYVHWTFKIFSPHSI